MQLPVSEVATILESTYSGDKQVAQGYTLDSRRVRPGEFFFAIRGQRLDGHQFVQQAIEAGAVAAVVEPAFLEQHPSLASRLIPVPDTTRALQVLAQEVRRRWGKKLIAITGSTGKTTTKELTAALLATQYAVHKSRGNLNNQYGVPLTLLELEPRHEVAVLELAMSAAGEIARLAQMAEPDIGVVTNVAAAHLQSFNSVEEIARAKRELIENLNPRCVETVAVLNHDDPRVKHFGDGFPGRVVTFGREAGADFIASEIKSAGGQGTTFRVTGPSLNAQFQLSLPGEHNIENALAAIATASLLGVPPEAMVQELATSKNLPGRSEILTLPGGITVINDSYNSNPRAMEKMLQMLAEWPGAQRRIVVAGEMLELGSTSPEWHRAVGRKCAECGVDCLFAVQGHAVFFLEGARENGMAASQLCFFATALEAAEYCRTHLREGDVVLVKGSRAVGLEAVIELLINPVSSSPATPHPAASTRAE